MRKIIKKALGPLAIFAMALIVGLSVAKEKTPVGVKAAPVYTITEDFETQTALTSSYADGNFVGAGGITFYYGHSRNQGSYPIDGKGIMLRRASDSYLEFQLEKGLSGLKFKYRKGFTGSGARQLELLVNNTQVSLTAEFGAASGALATIFDFVYEPDVSHSGLINVKIKVPGTADSNRQVILDNIQIAENSASTDVITALSVTPTSKIYYTTDTLQETDFAVNLTKNGATAPGSSANYDYFVKIGTGTGTTFVGEYISWGVTQPLTTHTNIQFKACLPQTAGNTDFIIVDIPITVSVPTLSSIAITGNMTKTSYFVGGVWNPAGLTVTATYTNSAVVDVTNEVVWTYNPATPNSTTITSVAVTATYNTMTAVHNENVTVTERPVSVVISEVYGGGGNSGATYVYDYVELYNLTNADIDLSTYSLWYGSSTGGTLGQRTPLSGTILANGYFLIKFKTNDATVGAVSKVLEDIDASVTGFNIAGSNFKVAISNSETAPTGADDTSVVDFVGAGTANDYEGSGTAPAPNATTSISRKLTAAGIPQDTNDNAADFELTTGGFSPMNSALGVANFIMAENTEGQCTTRFALAKAQLLKLSAAQLEYFKTGAQDETATLLTDARARYVAWSVYLGESNIYGAGGGSPRIDINTEKDNTISVAVAIGVIGLTAMAGYYFLTRKRKLA